MATKTGSKKALRTSKRIYKGIRGDRRYYRRMRRDLRVLGLGIAVIAVWQLVPWVNDHPWITGTVTALLVAAVVTVAYLIRRARLRRFAAKVSLAETDTMTGTQFEYWCADLLRTKGFRSVKVCGGAGDRGIDIVAKDVAGQRVIVQCKRYASRVGSQPMQSSLERARSPSMGEWRCS